MTRWRDANTRFSGDNPLARVHARQIATAGVGGQRFVRARGGGTPSRYPMNTPFDKAAGVLQTVHRHYLPLKPSI